MTAKTQLYKGEIKELSISMQMNWRNEIKIHTTDQYLDHLYRLREKETACHFCGFRDFTYMEVHHLDADHDNFDPSNLVPACTLCHRIHHIGWVGVKNHGQLVFIPNAINDSSEEIAPSVALFNHLQRVFILKDELSDEAQELMENAALFKTLEGTVLNNKRLVMNQSYSEYLQKKRDLKEKELQAGFSDNDKAVEAQDKITGDEAATTTLSLTGDYKASFDPNNDDSQDNALDLASGSILDLVVSLGDIYSEHKGKIEDNPALQFLEDQKKSNHGRFMVLFNPSVFEPFEPYASYSFEDRIRDYLRSDYFNTSKMGFVLESQLNKR